MGFTRFESGAGAKLKTEKMKTLKLLSVLAVVAVIAGIMCGLAFWVISEPENNIASALLLTWILGVSSYVALDWIAKVK